MGMRKINVENPKFQKGQRVVVTRDIKFHFGGGCCKKGEVGTVTSTHDFGIRVDMEKGYGMTFSFEQDLEEQETK